MLKMITLIQLLFLFPLKEARVAWNFALLREDRSKGIHNPDYAKALISNSIEALQP